MNYMGFSVPLLHWLRGYQVGRRGLQAAGHSPVPWPTAALEATWRMRQAAIPWVVALQQYNLLGSHDTPRVRSPLQGADALHRLAVTLLLTFPGVPGCTTATRSACSRPALVHARLHGVGRVPLGP